MLKYALIAATAISAAVFMFFKVRKKGGIVTATKALAAVCFVSLGFVMLSKLPSEAGFIMLFGLVLGMVGDVFLDASHVCPDEPAFLPVGMAAFAIEHIAVFCAVTSACGFSFVYFAVSLALGTAASLPYFCRQKNMNFGSLFYPAVLYASVLTATTLYYVMMTALGGLFLTVAIGAGLFFISDFIILFIIFGGKDTAKANTLNLATYFAAQIMYALSLGGLAV